MAWPVPPSGQWNPGFPMTPDINSYTPEQWALMQQQNWQQWAQWQQQYAQWQAQYGDKYTQQMQAFQTMAGFPPVPPTNVAPPPAPPPPDKPPPPPPHENDQPLYSKPKSNVTPVPPPTQTQNNIQLSYNDISTGNIQNKSYTTDSLSSETQSQPSVNTEALKKLAEEERLFDIQFQKWEEEIQKWKRENVNHPDKQAYNEYEQKFEACRAQLLERRNQMKEKRARLMGNNPQVLSSTNTGNKSTDIIPIQNTNYQHNIESNTLQKNNQNNYLNTSHTSMQYSSQPYNEKQKTGQTFNKNNKSEDYEDKYQSFNKRIDDYSHKPPPPLNSNFLANQSKGIPGLDLVPEGERPVTNKQYEIVDITEENSTLHHQQKPLAPDYSKISKGINNILGDEKIMNILSMVSHQKSNDSKNDNFDGSSIYYKSNQQNQTYNQHVSNNYSNNELVADTSYSDTYNNYQREEYISNDIPQSQYYNGPSQYGRPNDPPRQLAQNMPQTSNEYSNQHNFERNKVQEVNQINEPPKPKWVHEPLFAPSIIVDYEHKSLRLKARDFIEPVHMFDYNHTSKNDENSNKKDFGKEVDDLFVRKSRRRDDDDWSNLDKAYERRPVKEDNRAHSKMSMRDGNDFYNRRAGERYEERRRDDRLGRDDYDRRDKGNEYDRSKDRDYGRERDSHRDRDSYRERDGNRDRDLGKDRDIVRDKDLVNRDLDKDLIRERDIGRDRDLGRDRGRDLGRDRDFGRDRDTIRDRDPGRDRNNGRDRYRDRKDDFRNRSRSRERDNRKREHSKDNDSLDSFSSKKSKDIKEDPSKSQPGKSKPQHIVMIDDLLEEPGRSMRPQKIVIILRGAPGSGKSYLAKLIRDKEGEHGGTARIMSIDDYFVQEGEVEEIDPATGKLIKKPTIKYEYDESLEETYMTSLKRAFKRTITDGYYTFLIYDAINDQLKGYADIWNFARQNGFQVYICTMEMEAQSCYKRNIHKRKLEEIEVIIGRFFPTPSHHIHLDATTLLQSASIPDVHMEDADHVAVDTEGNEVEISFTSKWEKMEDAAQLARLDGTSKPLRPSQLSMEDYLQLDEWTPNKAQPGKKTVRWADIEERREQEKMRAIGFVVGQTDWNRMTDPTMGSSALTQTKYIERVRRF